LSVPIFCPAHFLSRPGRNRQPSCSQHPEFEASGGDAPSWRQHWQETLGVLLRHSPVGGSGCWIDSDRGSGTGRSPAFGYDWLPCSKTQTIMGAVAPLGLVSTINQVAEMISGMMPIGVPPGSISLRQPCGVAASVGQEHARNRRSRRLKWQNIPTPAQCPRIIASGQNRGTIHGACKAVG